MCAVDGIGPGSHLLSPQPALGPHLRSCPTQPGCLSHGSAGCPGCLAGRIEPEAAGLAQGIPCTRTSSRIFETSSAGVCGPERASGVCGGPAGDRQRGEGRAGARGRRPHALSPRRAGRCRRGRILESDTGERVARWRRGGRGDCES